MVDLLEAYNCPLDYVCAKTWLELTPTSVAKVRFCSQCKHEVYFCETMEEFEKRADAGQCVAYLCYKDEGACSSFVDNPVGLPKRIK
jgi:hypothetical protein